MKVSQIIIFCFLCGDIFAQEFATGFIPPKDGDKKSIKLPVFPQETMPIHWDWCEHDGVTPVKNQGSCGACYAFTTTAVVESAIKIKDHITVDISEQWIINCSINKGCSGGFYSFYMFMRKFSTWDTSNFGSVSEDECPFLMQNDNCSTYTGHTYYIESYHFLPSAKNDHLTDPEVLKKTIYHYGPVSSSIYVGPNFNNYRGGILESEDNRGLFNHTVTIVGWDETGTVPYWIVKNSWGTAWGEDGFVRMAYRASNIGMYVYYVEYKGQGNNSATGWEDYQ